MKISVTYEIPDGRHCTIDNNLPTGAYNYEHCQFRSSTYLDENKQHTVDCNIFKKKLELNAEFIPIKCTACLKACGMEPTTEIKEFFDMGVKACMK